jgi:hypothetical protein
MQNFFPGFSDGRRGIRYFHKTAIRRSGSFKRVSVPKWNGDPYPFFI